MLFGLFSGLKFLMVFLISSKNNSIYLFFSFLYLDSPQHGCRLHKVWSSIGSSSFMGLDTKSFKYNKNIKVIALLILILNVVTPKYYIWGEQVTYLRDSKLHFLDITGKNFEERNLYE